MDCQNISIDEYAKISHEYVKTKQHIWRKHVEEYSIRNMFGNMIGNSRDINVLELACGAGHYTNKLCNEWQIAKSVLATDLSPDMIDIAVKTYPDDIKMQFRVEDACCQRQFIHQHTFDIVFAAYLINYCCNYDMLLQMCTTIKMNLRPGGKFISVNDGCHHDVSAYDKIPGFNKVLANGDDGERVDFSPITIELSDPFDIINVDKNVCTFTNYWISKATIEKAFIQTGFDTVCIIPVTRSCHEDDYCPCRHYVDNQVICMILATV